MKTKIGVPGEVIQQLLAKFPDAGTKTLAAKAFKENPLLWRDVESARALIRHYRGACGAKKRAGLTCKEFIREPQAPADPFDKLQDGMTHFDDWRAIRIPGPLRALILSDCHLPYHSRDAIIAALKYGRDNAADTVFLNGDTLDCFALSKWEKDPRKRDFKKELETDLAFLQTLREMFPSARIILKEGNHEERFTRYMMVKAPEIYGIQKFTLPGLLELNNSGIQWISERRPVRLGDLNVIHGHEYPFAISNPVNPARGLFLRAKRFAMCGHFHQGSYHSEKDIEEQVTGTWSTGCLCDLHPDYAPLNKWNHGFAFVEVDQGGKFEVRNLFIGAGGKVY